GAAWKACGGGGLIRILQLHTEAVGATEALVVRNYVIDPSGRRRGQAVNRDVAEVPGALEVVEVVILDDALVRAINPHAKAPAADALHALDRAGGAVEQVDVRGVAGARARGVDDLQVPH